MSLSCNELPITHHAPLCSVPVWLRLLWSQVLFPGQNALPASIRLSALLVLLIVPGLLLYPTLGFHLFEPDEGRYAEIPREMLQRGEWVVPYLQSEPYLDKPPLLYWLVMLSYSLFGVAAWSARLVPALAIHGCILTTYLLGRRSVGERPAFWGALLLSLAPAFISVGRLLVLDGLLTLWITLALLSGFEAVRGERLRWRWWLLAASCCGLGILTKGPIAVILVFVPLGLYCWLSGRLSCVGPQAFLAFACLVLAVTAPWYIAICCKLPHFAGEFFWKHNVVRFLSPFDHLEPIWYYVPILLAGMLPGTLLLFGGVRFLISSRPEVMRQRCPEFGFMLLAGGCGVLFFSLSGCKLPTYILPALPPLALALGYYVVTGGWDRSRWLIAVTAAAFALLLFVHHAALPWYARFRSPFSRDADVIARCEGTPVVCYPRSCDSVAFYLGRDDFVTFRGKDAPALIEYLKQRSRTVILFTHRHSLQALREVLPGEELYFAEEMPLFDSARAGTDGWKYLLNKSPLGDGSRDSKAGTCYLGVVKRTAPASGGR